MSNSSDLFPQHRTTTLPGGYMGKILRVDLSALRPARENRQTFHEHTHAAGSRRIQRVGAAGLSIAGDGCGPHQGFIH